ncbi:MAG: hypothetical protein H0T42_22985 [Deltaproteobacteria bacterium]|nr:hypothetical protein [Deltaproteobacteria bacterium]
MKTTAVLVGLIAIGCSTSEPPPVDPAWPYPQIPEEEQRTGDPARGYDYLVNGGYITCGIPKSVYDSVVTPGDSGIPGRTGDNAMLPYNFSAATSAEGVRVVSANCLQCHAGSINGQLVIGLGAADADFTADRSEFVDLAGNFSMSTMERAAYNRFADRMRAIGPYTQTKTIGANPADNLTAVLMSHRDPATLAWSATPQLPLPPAIVAPVDVPPWWRMAKKTSMFYTAGGRGDHARIMMAAALLCTESVEEARAIDAAFVDVRAWIMSMPVPKWPFPLDAALVEQGKPIFQATCSRCHGTYGEDGYYPNEIVPIEEVGTDSTLAAGASQFSDRFVEWFAASFWGETSRLDPQEGYVPPPLDGIWATAPFFHNGSVPTLAAVLDSKKRPGAWTRTFDSNLYDQAAVGWKFTPTGLQSAEPNEAKRVRIYDTTNLGYGNQGHIYGDDLTAEERLAVLEYLKTL